MPMELRRRRLASQYSLKICSNLSNPARNCNFDERFTKLLRITSHASIFTAELVALYLALDIIRRSRCKKFVILSDSLSGLVAICNCLLETAEIHHQLLSTGQCRKLYYPDLDTRSYWYRRQWTCRWGCKSSSQLNSLTYEVPSLWFHSRAHYALSWSVAGWMGWMLC